MYTDTLSSEVKYIIGIKIKSITKFIIICGVRVSLIARKWLVVTMKKPELAIEKEITKKAFSENSKELSPNT
ncbi:hypothetical protein AL053_10010 [Pseudomonas savastanoi pv. fraxini]|nr:hypothetical protein AL053_10010 [Pseudomonas savastanoi pv. fraxini]